MCGILSTGTYLPTITLTYSLKITYLLRSTFLLAWIILPIQAEYHSSGYFTPQSKFKDAIVKNLAFLGVAAGTLTCSLTHLNSYTHFLTHSINIVIYCIYGVLWRGLIISDC